MAIFFLHKYIKYRSVSTKIEPIRDISIDLGNEAGGACSLLDCLKSYTCAETDINFNCENCQDNRKSTKQLSFKSLPIVFCFQLKRFEMTKVLTMLNFQLINIIYS